MQCNLCGSENLQEAINIPDFLITKDYSGSDFRFDLQFHYCNECGLLQICNPVSPSDLYGSKFYLTGFQQPKHIADLVTAALHYKNPGTLIEVGCNEGNFLREMKSYGFKEVAGIEPNSHAAERAESVGAIYHDYLTPEVAKRVNKEHGGFDFVVCRHVIEHVSNLRDFFEGLNILLHANGILIIELPHVEFGIDGVNPVLLSEEHVNYFTEQCLTEMLRHYGFEPLEKRYYTFGGGSLAMICRKREKISLIPELAKSYPLSYYQRYAERLKNLRAMVNDFIVVHNDHDIILYGAASRAAVFINSMGIADKIDYIFDDRKALDGLTMPGTNKKITHMINTPRQSLCLLGVGSESEWKVEKYFNKTLSLFAPRFNEKLFA